MRLVCTLVITVIVTALYSQPISGSYIFRITVFLRRFLVTGNLERRFYITIIVTFAAFFLENFI